MRGLNGKQDVNRGGDFEKKRDGFKGRVNIRERQTMLAYADGWG